MKTSLFPGLLLAVVTLMVGCQTSTVHQTAAAPRPHVDPPINYTFAFGGHPTDTRERTAPPPPNPDYPLRTEAEGQFHILWSQPN